MGCRWEVLVDGASCLHPGPMVVELFQNLGSSASNDDVVGMSNTNMLSCDRIPSGMHTLSVTETSLASEAEHGTPNTGWGSSTSLLFATEGSSASSSALSSQPGRPFSRRSQWPGIESNLFWVRDRKSTLLQLVLKEVAKTESGGGGGEGDGGASLAKPGFSIPAKPRHGVFPLAVAAGNNLLTYEGAVQGCGSHGARLASELELEIARLAGLQYCTASWLSDKSVRTSVSVASAACGLRTGVINAGYPSEDSLHDAICAFNPAGEELLFSYRAVPAKETDELSISTSGAISVQGAKLSAPFSLSDNKWHHIATSWSSAKGSLHVFQDKEQIASRGPGQAVYEWWRLDRGSRKVGESVFAFVPNPDGDGSTPQWTRIVAIGPRRGNGNDVVVKRAADGGDITITESAILVPKHATSSGDDDLPGTTLEDLLTSNMFSNAKATGEALVSTFEAPRLAFDNFASRITALFIPPQSGEYTFFVSCADACGLYLSTSSDPSGLSKIAEPSCSGALAPTARDFSRCSGQSSESTATIVLIAGKQYLLRADHIASGGNDHLAVGVCMPDNTCSRVEDANDDSIGPIPASMLYLPSYATIKQGAVLTTGGAMAVGGMGEGTSFAEVRVWGR